MKTQLRVLHLEDSPCDAELVRTRLEEEGFDCDLVLAQNRAAFESAIAQGPFDLIISDFALPDLDGLTALSLAREKQPRVPFILLSGTLGEEHATRARATRGHGDGEHVSHSREHAARRSPRERHRLDRVPREIRQYLAQAVRISRYNRRCRRGDSATETDALGLSARR